MRLIALVLCAVASIPHLTAQAPPLVAVGDRVRIAVPTLGIHSYDGTLMALDGDSLVVDTLRVARLRLTRLEVFRGRRSNAVRWALLGGIPAGAATASLVLAYCAAAGDGFLSCHESPGYAAIVAIGFGVGFGAGAVIGGTLGALIKSDRWHAVPLGALDVQGPREPQGLGIGLSLRF